MNNFKEKLNIVKEKAKNVRTKSLDFVEDHFSACCIGTLIILGTGLYTAIYKMDKKETRRFYDEVLKRDDLNLEYVDRSRKKITYYVMNEDED